MVELPPTYRPALIALFVREAVTPDTTASAEGEGYGEYQIQLVDAALKLQDPATLRGLAYLGVQVNQASQVFLAQHGAMSLPFLEEAWANDSTAHSGIMDTWALLVGRYTNNISRSQRIGLLRSMLDAAIAEPVDFIAAAVAAPLLAATPILALWSSPDTAEVLRSFAQEALQKLTTSRAALSPGELQQRMADWLSAICLSAAGMKATACNRLSPLIAAGPSDGGALSAFAITADFAFQDGTFTPLEHVLLAANADSLLQFVLRTVLPWSPGVTYAVDDSASFNGLYYQCRQAHTAQAGWEPPNVYALWSRIASGETWAPQVLYAVGNEVAYRGVRYRVIQAHQSQPGWEPPNVPALWVQVP